MGPNPPTAPAVAPPGAPARGGRDSALDLLRAVALARVLLWHFTAQTWLTWFAAMPLMFFVAGSLLAPRDGYATFLRRRLRRLLLPFWVYGASVAVFSLAYSLDTHQLSRTSPLRSLAWILPVVDPSAAAWSGGWLSTHLWYLRAYLWIVLLAPLLVLAARRLRVTAVAVVATVVGLELAAAAGLAGIGHGTTRVLLGDIVVYGFFATVGIWYGRGRPLPRPAVLAAAAAAVGAAAVAFAAVAGLPSGGVNASYPAVALTGVAWLLAVGAAERPLHAFAARPGLARATRFVTSRALTIYLWHPVAIVIAERLVPAPGPAAALLRFALVIALVAAAVVAIGRVEDAASGRSARRSGTQRRVQVLGTAAALSTLGIAVVTPLMPLTTEANRTARLTASSALVTQIPAPSARQALSDSAFTTRNPPATTVSPFATAPVTTVPVRPKAAAPVTGKSTATRPAATTRRSATRRSTATTTGRGTVPAKATASTTPSRATTVAPASLPSAKAASRSPATSTPATSTPATGAPTSSPRSGATAAITAPTAATVVAAKAAAKAAAALPADRLQDAFDDWRLSQNPAITSAIVAIRTNTQTWSARSAGAGVTSRYKVDQPFPAVSITKTFTAALVLREVAKGTLTLDDPLPVLRGLNVPVPDGLTVRRLLTHTSGLTDYPLSNGYDSSEVFSPLDAVAMSLSTPPENAPGTTVVYGNTNYLYLGLLLEQVTGKSYRTLVGQLTDSVGLKRTTVDQASTPGWVGFSSGGILSTADDLTAWAQALFTPGKVLSDRSLTLMTTIGDANLGLGVWPACPCWTDAQGTKRATAIGHQTGDGGMFWFPSSGLIVVAMFEPDGLDTHARIVSLAAALTAALR